MFFSPYERDERLSRPWAIPGTAGLEHRIGGLEKANITGNVSYDPANHEGMIHLRAQKVANIAADIPLQELDGAPKGDLLVLSWGGTFGACATAVHAAQKAGKKVTHCHLRYLNPFPRNFETILRSFKQILIPELNMGQLSVMIRSQFLIDAICLNKVQGKPFNVFEVTDKINSLLA